MSNGQYIIFSNLTEHYTTLCTNDKGQVLRSQRGAVVFLRARVATVHKAPNQSARNEMRIQSHSSAESKAASKSDSDLSSRKLRSSESG